MRKERIFFSPMDSKTKAPRNSIIRALNRRRSAGAGRHGRSTKGQRRADRMQLQKGMAN